MDITIDEFFELMKNEIMSKLEDVTITKNKITKNNGVELLGMLIRKNKESVSPQVYIQQYYDSYLKGVDIQTLCDQLIESYGQSLLDIPYCSAENLLNYASVKDKIYYRLVNAEKNQAFLDKSPHKIVGDLAIIYSILISQQQEEFGTIRITHDILHEIGINENTLFDLAEKNTPVLLPSKLTPMIDMIADMIGQPLDSEESSNINMYVLTNLKGINGASTICYPEILQILYNKFGQDYIIIPSSVHEVIVMPLPNNNPENIDTVTRMVQEINGTEVAEDEVLSDRAYLYSEFVAMLSSN